MPKSRLTLQTEPLSAAQSNAPHAQPLLKTVLKIDDLNRLQPPKKIYTAHWQE